MFCLFFLPLPQPRERDSAPSPTDAPTEVGRPAVCACMASAYRVWSCKLRETPLGHENVDFGGASDKACSAFAFPLPAGCITSHKSVSRASIVDVEKPDSIPDGNARGVQNVMHLGSHIGDRIPRFQQYDSDMLQTSRHTDSDCDCCCDQAWTLISLDAPASMLSLV